MEIRRLAKYRQYAGAQAAKVAQPKSRATSASGTTKKPAKLKRKRTTRKGKRANSTSGHLSNLDGPQTLHLPVRRAASDAARENDSTKIKSKKHAGQCSHPEGNAVASPVHDGFGAYC